MSKVKSMQEALDLIQDGSVVAATGFVLWGLADEVFKAVEDRFLETGPPNKFDLRLYRQRRLGRQRL